MPQPPYPIHVDSLVIETTRRCNMSCAHCLRGSGQPMDMSQSYIDTLFSQLHEVSCITFSGGEPTLNPKPILWSLQAAQKYNVPISQFYVITNGKMLNPDFDLYLDQLYDYCISNQISDNQMYDDRRWIEQDFFGITISLDKYHEPIPMQHAVHYSRYAYYRRHDKYNESDQFLIARGRAADKTQFPNAMQRSVTQPSIEVWEDTWNVDTLYLAASGHVTCDCDLSYEQCDTTESIGHIANSTIHDMLRPYL